MNLKKIIDKVNKNQMAKGYFFMLMCYLFAFIYNPFYPFIEPEGIQEGIFPIALIGAVFYTCTAIKGLITKKDVWKDFNFGLVNSEKDIKEGEKTQKVKKVLKFVLFGLICFFTLFILLVLIGISLV